ncbi:MAG: Re/Si-specific NAD(P)(+) transhydrogenase subunit alpha [Gammaproteobacteria bacterium]
MKISVPKERTEGEKRVASVPEVVSRLVKLGAQVVVESEAGASAYHRDDAYRDAGATITEDAGAVYADADIVLRVQPPALEEAQKMRAGSILIGFLNPPKETELIKCLRDRRITALAMELVPRIARAQAMDALSSQASIAGYEAVLIAAKRLGKMIPMLTTPTGTIRPAKFLIIGAGVAGLQAIATARRLGAMVEAYDVRTATKEQVQSLGAKFLQTDIKAEAEGGYARELTEEEKQKQQDMLAKHIAQADVVITTAAIPGQASPKIIFKHMVQAMRPGSVIVDLAAEGGGNCDLTQPGKVVRVRGNDVDIEGPLNVPSSVPVHASETYAKNLYNMVALMISDGRLAPNWEDEVLRDSTLTRDGEIKHGLTRQLVEGGA